jgi:NAD-dependent DNA ligase
VNIGYDGEEGVIYTMPSLKLMNNYVFNTVTEGNRERILSYWGAISGSECSKMGEAVENLVWQDLQQGCLFQTWNMTGQKFETLPNLTSILETRTGRTMADLSGIFENDNELVCMAPGIALIDFAGPGRRVYQATVSADHSMSLVGLQELLTAGGYMKLTGTNSVMVADAQLPKLGYYWVVPHEKIGAWMGKSGPKTVRDEQVRLALETYVNQFILSVDVKPPSVDDIAEILLSQGVWKGGNVVLAGTIAPDSKAKIKAIVERKGGKVQDQVDRFTLFVIDGTGVENGQLKIKDAIRLEKPRVTTEKFLQQEKLLDEMP